MAVQPCLDSVDVEVAAWQADLHLFFKVVAQHPVQLLHVMLHEALHGVPPKRLSQIFRGDTRVPKL